ncbi:MAG: ribokinase [Candidatus Cohnella colombiensis]|uniref:Ribokinase n=1 Tax=Candidatus Cohnella colombiensis TaxID=3121368 RepID=A0AA95JFT6_9BACL|nr:MAG: ribokinase [Cohnella sp.]
MIDRKPVIVVIGSLNMDIVIEADRQPQMGETILGNKITFLPGGKGANQAVALARLGARTVMIGAVGNDAFGQQMIASLDREGVDTSGIKIVDGEVTGLASILLAQGDNCIVCIPGANAHCTPEDVERNLSIIEAADMILLQMEIPLDTIRYTITTAKRLGKRVILNPAPATPLPADLLEQVDYLTPNFSELQILLETNEGNVTELIKQMQVRKVDHIIVTQGDEGATFVGQDGLVGRVSSHKVNVVDTTGAGDAFNAGLAFSIAMNESLKDAVFFANATAAQAVTKYGAQNGMPNIEDVKKLLSEL